MAFLHIIIWPCLVGLGVWAYHVLHQSKLEFAMWLCSSVLRTALTMGVVEVIAAATTAV